MIASAEPGGGALLEGIAVGQSFGSVVALDGVSLALRRGELLGLVGPDGAGKTTLVRALTGLLVPTRGESRIDGIAWRDAPESAREALGYMPQQYGLYADLSVAENLRFFADLFGLARADFETRRAELLRLTRLEHAIDRPAGALSGGMYKKLALACALLHRPSVLVLDEPTNGVDPVSRRELWELLHGLVHEGLGVLLATPYMDEAERCSRVVLLTNGRVLAEGSPHELVAGFEHSVFRVDVDDPRRLGPIQAELEATPSVLAVTPAGPRVKAVVLRRAAEEVRQRLEAAGARVSPVRADFEDLYLSRVAGAA